MCKYVKVSLPEGMALRIRDELNISLGIVSHEQPQETKEQSDSSASPVQQLKAEIAKVIPRLTQAYVDMEERDFNNCISELATLSR